MMKPDNEASNLTPWGGGSRDQSERIFLEGPKSRSFEIRHALKAFVNFTLSARV
jgi:hypothetical protein